MTDDATPAHELSPEDAATIAAAVDAYAEAWSRLRSEFESMIAAYTPHFTAAVEAFRELYAYLRPVIDAYEADPEGFKAAIAAERARVSCHCLCGMHRDTMGICEGEAEPGAFLVIDSPTVGRQHIPMCRPCLTADRSRAHEVPSA